MNAVLGLVSPRRRHVNDRPDRLDCPSLVVRTEEECRHGVKGSRINGTLVIACNKPVAPRAAKGVLRYVKSRNDLKGEELTDSHAASLGNLDQREVAWCGTATLVAGKGPTVHADAVCKTLTDIPSSPLAHTPYPHPKLCGRYGSVFHLLDVLPHRDHLVFSRPNKSELGKAFLKIMLQDSETGSIVSTSRVRMEKTMTQTQISDNLCSNLALLRRHSRISQSALGLRYGVSGQAVSAWEHGRCEPSYAILVDLATVYGIQLEDFHTLTPEQIEHLPKVEVEG